ncbi:MAG: tetratricopeptide repeat protein [Kiritimatiellae bacterium]|nr:tetratricopeptide repeat protein [Kiritimatiellia bacterium]
MKEFFARHTVASGLIALVIVCAYANSFWAGFVFDDTKNIVENVTIRTFRSSLANPSRPLVQLSFYLNYALGGLHPAGYHLVNVLIHVLAAIVLFALVRTTLIGLGVGDVQSSLVGMVSGLIWGVHPLNTESVTYVSQRVESLMGLFYLVTLRAAAGYLRTDGRGWLAAAVVCCGLGMATKEVMITAPVTVALYAWFFAPRPLANLVRRKWPLWTGLGASWVVLASLMRATRRVDLLNVYVFQDYAPLEYALTQCKVVVHYLRLAFFPYPLCLDYSLEPVRTITGVLPQATFLGCLVLITIWLTIRRRPAGMPLAAALLILSPTSSIVPRPDLAFEHRMYLPLAAIVALIVALAARLLRGRLRPSVVVPGVATVVIALGITTVLRNRDYASEESMWRDVVEKRPLNLRARIDYAVALSEKGDADAALREYNTALSLIPKEEVEALLAPPPRVPEFVSTHSYRYHYVRAHANMGQLLYRLGRVEEAIDHYVLALKAFPSYERVRAMLRNALLATGVPKQKVEEEIERRIGPPWPLIPNG